MSTKNSSRFTPVIIAVSVVVGILIGTFYAKHFAGNRLGIINGSSNKLNALLRIVDDQYVDTVNMTDLVEKAMPQILAELDPHSTYIPAQNLEEVNSELEGSFSGIGIQFTIQNDTIHVNAVVQGGFQIQIDSQTAVLVSCVQVGSYTDILNAFFVAGI